MIYDPAGNNQTIGNQIVVLPQSKGGTVINFFNEILNFSNRDHKPAVRFQSCVQVLDNRGATWLPKNKPVRAQTLATLAQFRAFGTILPDDPDIGVRGGDILFDVAVNRSNGNLYAVWQDARFSGFLDRPDRFSQSTDGGSAWSAPIKANLTKPNNIPILRQQAFTPSVSIEATGRW